MTSVIEQIDQLCEVLRTNYQSYAMDSHRISAQKAESNGDTWSVNYHKEQIDKLAMGEGVDQFIYTIGKKYAKIIHVTSHGVGRSSHAFVDLKTGDVYKSASWNAPAKGIRYNLVNDNSRKECFKNADWAGSYLYLR